MARQETLREEPTTHLTRRLASLIVPLIALVIVPLGCGDDDDDGGGMGPGSSLQTIAGTWSATSFVVGGMEIVTGGLTFSITFQTDGTYSSSATNDTGGFFCDTATSCTDSGAVSATASTLTLDAGTQDEETLSYTVSGNTITLTGTIDGSQLVASFTKTA